MLFALLPALPAQKLDHMGIVVHDLAAAERFFRDRLGFTIGLRGRLPDGTMDTSIDFRNGQYLELITVTDRAKAMVRQGDLVQFSDRQEGPFFIALQTPSAARTAAQLRKQGWAIDGPAGNSWTLDGVAEPFPEGWLRVRFTGPGLPGSSLFFIEYHDRVWKQMEKKFPQLKDDPKRAIHANGAIGIRAAWVAVNHLDQASRAFERAGLKPGQKTGEIEAKPGTILLMEKAGAEGVAGLTLEVADIARTAAELHLSIYQGRYGRSVKVGEPFAIEFCESAAARE